MMRVKVTQRRIPNLQNAQFERLIKKVEMESAEEIVSVAKQLAPKDTGTMADSIHVEVSDFIRVVVGVPYGKYPEYGTVKQAAQPFLRPAKNAEIKRLRARLGKIHAGLGKILGTTTRVNRGRTEPLE